MEVRLNKLISDSGLCSRREADKYIEEGRVTVNGSLPHTGQKVSEGDIVMLDDIQIKINKRIFDRASSAPAKPQEPTNVERKAKPSKPRTTTSSEKKATAPASGSKGLRPGKYVKYNKYAAARHAARNGESPHKKKKEEATFDTDALREALRPQFGKSLGRSAVAQRLAASPKSAALRKTSRNNPLNKAKRAAARNKPKGE